VFKQFLTIFFLGFAYVVSAQNENTFFTALKNSDTASMEIFMEDNLDFCLFEDQQILTKKVALGKLKEFLQTHKVTAVEVIHKGTSKDKSSQYKVVKLVTPRETFRMFVYSSGEIGARTIKEIRIDKF